MLIIYNKSLFWGKPPLCKITAGSFPSGTKTYLIKGRGTIENGGGILFRHRAKSFLLFYQRKQKIPPRLYKNRRRAIFAEKNRN